MSDGRPAILVARDAAALAKLAADRIASALSEAARGPDGSRSVSVALAGGRTPRAAYVLLARDRRVPWERLDVFLGDERCVPPSSEQSNLRMVREALAERLRPEAIHPPWPPAGDPEPTPAESPAPEALERAARAYATQLPERLDLLLLGVGADGHVASLFPGSPALGETERRVVPARAPVAPHERLTITPPVIAAARRLLVLVSGADKAEAVARALARTAGPDAPPARLARRATWLLDRASAAKLSR